MVWPSMFIINENEIVFLELGVTEHIEGDETKFAVWTGRAPMVADYRVVLKAHNLETKQMWVKKLREVIQETYFAGASLTFPKSPAKSNANSNNNSNAKNPSQRSSRDLDEAMGENDNDVSSLASFGSGNTTDSDKVSGDFCDFLADYGNVHGDFGEYIYINRIIAED